MTNLSKLEPCIRAQLVLQNIIKNQKLRQDSNEWSNSIKKIMNCKLCFQKQQRPFSESIRKTATICQEVAEDRKKHIKAIELSCAKRIYDNLQEYQTHVIEVQGKDECEDFIQNVKQEIFGTDNILSKETERLAKTPKYAHLATELTQWEDIIEPLCTTVIPDDSNKQSKEWYKILVKARCALQKITCTIKQVRYEEWRNAKNHYIRIGSTVPSPE
jgi:hypothetical protein